MGAKGSAELAVSEACRVGSDRLLNRRSDGVSGVLRLAQTRLLDALHSPERDGSGVAIDLRDEAHGNVVVLTGRAEPPLVLSEVILRNDNLECAWLLATHDFLRALNTTVVGRQ